VAGRTRSRTRRARSRNGPDPDASDEIDLNDDDETTEPDTSHADTDTDTDTNTEQTDTDDTDTEQTDADTEQTDTEQTDTAEEGEDDESAVEQPEDSVPPEVSDERRADDTDPPTRRRRTDRWNRQANSDTEDQYLMVAGGTDPEPDSALVPRIEPPIELPVVSEADSSYDADARRLAPLRLDTIARYAAYFFAAVITSAVIAALLVLPQPKVYGAEAEILYELDENLEAGFLREDRRLTTQVVTIESRAILAPAGGSVGLTADEMLDVLDVGVVDGSEIIHFQTRGPSPEEALDRAEAITATYLQFLDEADSSDEAQLIVDDELAKIETELAEIESQILAFSSSSPDAGTSPELAILLARADGLADQRTTLENRKNELELNDLIKPKFSMLTEPYSLDDPLEPQPLRTAALGALVGAVVGFGIVLVAERRNPRLR
jgi:hypothetical protein